VNPDDVTRAEIFQLMTEIRSMIAFGLRVVYVLAGLVVLQILVKFWETRKVLKALDMTARHGTITDAQRARTEGLLVKAVAVLEKIDHGADVAASAATLTAEEAAKVKGLLTDIQHQTNAMKDQLVAGAGREGVTRGRAEEKAEEKERTEKQLERVEVKVDEVKDGVEELKDRVKPNGETSER
jgi:hypothetical protein